MLPDKEMRLSFSGEMKEKASAFWCGLKIPDKPEKKSQAARGFEFKVRGSSSCSDVTPEMYKARETEVAKLIKRKTVLSNKVGGPKGEVSSKDICR